MVNNIIEQEYIKISKGVTVCTVAMVVCFVIEWSIPEGNAVLFFKRHASDILKLVCGYSRNFT